MAAYGSGAVDELSCSRAIADRGMAACSHAPFQVEKIRTFGGRCLSWEAGTSPESVSQDSQGGINPMGIAPIGLTLNVAQIRRLRVSAGIFVLGTSIR